MYFVYLLSFNIPQIRQFVRLLDFKILYVFSSLASTNKEVRLSVCSTVRFHSLGILGQAEVTINRFNKNISDQNYDILRKWKK